MEIKNFNSNSKNFNSIQGENEPETNLLERQSRKGLGADAHLR